jgi:hypothetical protein
MAATSEQRSPEATKRLARLAGAVYLTLGLATAIGFYHAPLALEDLGAIGRALIKSDLRFRIGVVTDLLSTALAVPLALLFYQLFEPVQRTQAALMALLLIVAMPISFVVALNYVAAQWLLSGAPVVAAIPGTQREALGMLFLGLHTHGVLAVEIFWGLWLLPFGLLVIRSRYLPRALGLLLIVGAVAYISHSITSLLLGGQRFILYERVTMLARAAAEFPTMLWLLIKGADARTARSSAA